MNQEQCRTIIVDVSEAEISVKEMLSFRQPANFRIMDHPIFRCRDLDNLHEVISTNYGEYPDLKLCVVAVHEEEEFQFDLCSLRGCENITKLFIAPSVLLKNLEGISELIRLKSFKLLSPVETVAGIEFCHSLTSLKLYVVPEDIGLISGLAIQTLFFYDDGNEGSPVSPTKIELLCLKKTAHLLNLLRTPGRPLLSSYRRTAYRHPSCRYQSSRSSRGHEEY